MAANTAGGSMATVKSIMEQHGGGITIESPVGQRNYCFTDAAGCNAYRSCESMVSLSQRCP